MSDHITRAAEVLTEAWEDRVRQGISDEPRGHCHAFADALADAGLLASPEHDAAVAARALREAQGDIKARIQNMRSCGADSQYLNALHDSWGLLNNRASDVERAPQSDTVTLPREDAERLLDCWAGDDPHAPEGPMYRRVRAALGWGDSDDT